MIPKTINKNHPIENDCFLNLKEIDCLLKSLDKLKEFWTYPNSQFVIRAEPQVDFPIYEIQLIYACGEQVESYAWLWLDAIGGEFIYFMIEK